MARTRTQGWPAGAAASLAAHGLLLLGILLTFRTFRRPPEPPAMTVQLLPRTAAPAPRREPRPGRGAAAAATVPGPQAPTAPTGAAAPTPLATAAGPQAGSLDAGAGLAGVRAALRAAVGCTEGRLLKLTRAERDRCAERLGRKADPNVAWPAPMAPEKRAWFDAAAQARGGPGRPPALGCALLFGRGGIKAPKATHALKLGPLPATCCRPRGR